MEDKKNALIVAGDQVAAAPTDTAELYKWVGRQQAFGLIANLSAVSQAEALKRMRDSGEYRKLGLNWDQFCDRELGLTKRTADRIIANLEEFGAAYFNMSGVMRISASSYRLIAGSVTEEGLDVGGEVIPITKANADRIAEAVNTLRKEAESARAQATESKSATEVARKERDNARTAARNLEQALRDARDKEANRYASATPNEKALIEADEAMRYATARVERVLNDAKASDEDKSLARDFAFAAVKAFYTRCGLTPTDLFAAEQMPGGRSPIAEHLDQKPTVKDAMDIARKVKK